MRLVGPCGTLSGGGGSSSSGWLTSGHAGWLPELFLDLPRLLQAYVRQGRKAGVPSHKLVAWVRRKLGSNIAVWRCTTDGALARAAPCLFCSRELLRFDIRVHCPTDASGGWFSGRLSDVGAPVPALTGGQQRVLRAQGWRLCADPVPPQTEAIQAPQQQQQRQQRGQRHTQKQQQQQQQQQRRRRPQ